MSTHLLLYEHSCSAGMEQTSSIGRTSKASPSHPSCCRLLLLQAELDPDTLQPRTTELTSACQLSQQELLPLLAHLCCKGSSKALERVRSQGALNLMWPTPGHSKLAAVKAWKTTAASCWCWGHTVLLSLFTGNAHFCLSMAPGTKPRDYVFHS